MPKALFYTGTAFCLPNPRRPIPNTSLLGKLFRRYPRLAQRLDDFFAEVLNRFADGSRTNFGVTESPPIDILTQTDNRK